MKTPTKPKKLPVALRWYDGKGQAPDFGEAQAVVMLDMLSKTAFEASHMEADDIVLLFLRTQGHTAIAQAFSNARDRCGFAYA